MNTRRRGSTTYESPLGRLTLIAGPTGVSNLYFAGRSPRLAEEARQPIPGATEQLDAHFTGERQAFKLELDRGADGDAPAAGSVNRQMVML
jgi:hypothetical protein